MSMDERRTGGLPSGLEQAFERQRRKEMAQEARLLSRTVRRTAGVPSGPAMRDHAEHVGYVILQAAEVDLRAAAVASLLHSGPAGYRGDMLGLSGAQLVRALRTGFDVEPAQFEEFVTRYEAAYRRRNQIVHAVRPDGDREGDAETFERTVRAVRVGTNWVSSLNSAQLSIETITVEDLIEFEFELQLLNASAGGWFGALKDAGFGPVPEGSPTSADGDLDG